MTNRRSSARIKRRLKVRFGQPGGRESVGFTTNVAADGFFVATRHIERPGTELKISVDLPGAGSLEIAAQVAWARRVPANLQTITPGGFGVHITCAPKDWAAYVSGIAA